MILDQPIQKRHLGELDSLRGIAGVTMMLFHFHFLWEESPHSSWQESLFMLPSLKFVIAGHAAVVLFFLLSGFVLALPVIHGRQALWGYLVKRVQDLSALSGCAGCVGVGLLAFHPYLLITVGFAIANV
jgi:peptidoglycan/LPS O-acetylase OafA/YrhL